ncbi:hypothetical protein RAC89_19125 [Paenibacillus sp. GD4]|uniref:hypothetical protein n=1 Tax=Paenibacillus sp. GD4 TaxID=3068890 RepID=UPI0027963F24|nr:hypothetical protein [Paenibacillus sp. GD4]MDQ1912509.1 hypothetical protein [Paenibacillus sp. GD4]
MAIRRFEKEDEKQQYLNWRKDNPDGFVLNINSWNPQLTSMNNVIHSARYCSSLDKSRTENRERLVTPEHHKLCSTDIRDLEDEMVSKGLPFKRCGLCLK